MISIFNRRKLTIVFSTKELVRVRSILAAAHIEYKVRMVQDDKIGESQVRRAELAWDGYLRNDYSIGPSISYVFYVKKQDFFDASALTRRRKRSL